MKLLTICVAILFSITILAQTNGINYKALIKDANGNVVNNTSTTIEFTIYKGVGLFNTYRETHAVFTDDNGILITNIGEGSIVNGNFNAVNWSDDEYFLGVKIDTGTGYVDLGITAFKTVPYALNAKNVKGLEPLDEGNGIGWRLVGKDPTYYGNIGANAIDLSNSTLLGEFRGARGTRSFAIGSSTIALGENSVASGFQTQANGKSSVGFGWKSKSDGDFSLSSGFEAEALGNSSTSLGSNTEALGGISFATGKATKAFSYAEVVVGIYNTEYVPSSIMNWQSSDRIFNIGNGILSTARSDAFTVLKNGTITAPSFDISEITDDKALITKEYLETNVSGLEALDEGNGIGWRLKGLDPNNFGNIGLGAINLSDSSVFPTVDFIGAIGDYSFTAGINTYAIGYASVSMGASQAHGDYATAFGQGQAEADYSFSNGFSVYAKSYGETALGYFNEYYTPSVDGETQPNPTDRLFTIGNGTSSTRSNALTILKNGTITAPSFDVSEITNNKALITKEYADQNLQNSGLEALNETNGNGYRLIGSNAVNYGNIGGSATDLSASFFASTTLGATGNYAFASGYETTASGDYSSSFGFETIASGAYANSFGYSTNAIGFYATSTGLSTNADAYVSTSMGRYNIGGGNASTWVSTDPILEVGNGTSSISSNALTILKNGSVGITTSTPATKLHITGGGDASLANGSGYFVMGNVTGANMVFDENEIIARNNGVNSPMYLQNTGGNVAIGAVNPSVALDIVGSIEYTGTITDVSDKRLKENFTSIDTVLERLQKIQGYTYNMKDDVDKKREYGVIAQDLQKVFPEMVSVIDTENQYLGVSYIQLIPVLLEAIKEQQQIIESQNKKYNNLLNRIEALENTESDKIALKTND